MGRFMVQADNGDIGSVKFEGGDGNKDILIPKEGGTLATEQSVLDNSVTAGAGLQKSGTTLNFYPYGLTTATTELTTSDFVVVSDSTIPKKITIANFANELPILGVGQTWQDVTASRSAGVTYTNSTEKPIQVGIKLLLAGDKYATVDGVAQFYLGSNTNNTATITFIVPNNSTYILNVGTAVNWYELR